MPVENPEIQKSVCLASGLDSRNTAPRKPAKTNCLTIAFINIWVIIHARLDSLIETLGNTTAMAVKTCSSTIVFLLEDKATINYRPLSILVRRSCSNCCDIYIIFTAHRHANS